MLRAGSLSEKSTRPGGRLPGLLVHLPSENGGRWTETGEEGDGTSPKENKKNL